MNQLSENHQSDASTFTDKKIPVKSLKPKRTGFAVQLIITLLLLGLLFALTLFVAYRAGNKENPPTTFVECANLRNSIVQESYPAVCVTKDGTRFIQEIPEEETKFCGGIANIRCPEGYSCKLDGSFPDAGGVCIEN